MEGPQYGVSLVRTMLGSTGNRCGIYEKIDALDGARSVSDLVKRLKPILSELAYYAVTGEAAVMETREEWHAQYTDALYSATTTDHSADIATARGAQAPAVRRATSSGRSSHAPAASGEKSRREPQIQAAPPANRPRPSDISASLRAIMDGSHPSFKEDSG